MPRRSSSEEGGKGLVTGNGAFHILLQLQEVDSEQAALERERQALEEAPELAQARARVEAREQAVRELRDRQTELTRELAWAEKEAAELRRKQDELDRKLYSGEVANPKELDQMRRKLESIAVNAGSLDDRALGAMEELETLKPALEVEIRALEAEREALGATERLNAGRRAEVEASLAAIPDRRRALAGSLESSLLGEYERVRSRRGGVGAVRLTRGICGGCRVAVPPVLLGQARQGRLVKCESCGRLLCWVDD